MISIKTPEEIKIMSEGAKILAKIMKELKKRVKPGVATEELDRAAEALILEYGAKPNFKGYDDFPAVLCTSVNEAVVHSVPSKYRLKEGDILSLDLGLVYRGFNSDMAITVPVGEVSSEARRLVRVTKKSLKRGIKKVKPGSTFGDIGNSIQRYVEGQGFRVVRILCGHGIGKKLHEDPQIPNYGKRKTGPKIREGMIFCIEPMVTIGSCKLKKAKDGYGFQTADGSLSAHFEHMVAVTKTGSRVLTEL